MRKAHSDRNTNETQISVNINLDGEGEYNINSGIPFFDHMLITFSKHSMIDIDLRAKGDIEVDFHHTVEDVGIALGEVFLKALGDKSGISRFSDVTIPLDEAISKVTLDISGRPYLYYSVDFKQPDDGNGVNPYLFEEFFRGFVNSAKITMHIENIRGNNSHHILESIFKAFAVAIKTAIKKTSDKLPTTKGVL